VRAVVRVVDVDQAVAEVADEQVPAELAEAGRRQRCQYRRLPWRRGRGGAVTEEQQALASSRERFEDLVDELIGTEGVTPPRGGSGFGRSALRFHGKIFAMHVRGALVLKLPADRVDALVRAGAGVHFDANKGTPMREWLSLDPDSALPWLPLATEALDFASSARRQGSPG
jgi:hypothetical protein